MGFVPGARRAPIISPKVATVVDTSGSMSDPMLAEISKEIAHLSRTYEVAVVGRDCTIQRVCGIQKADHGLCRARWHLVFSAFGACVFEENTCRRHDLLHGRVWSRPCKKTANPCALGSYRGRRMPGDVGEGYPHGRKIDLRVPKLASFVPKFGHNHRIFGTHGSISGPQRRNFVFGFAAYSRGWAPHRST